MDILQVCTDLLGRPSWQGFSKFHMRNWFLTHRQCSTLKLGKKSYQISCAKTGNRSRWVQRIMDNSRTSFILLGRNTTTTQYIPLRRQSLNWVGGKLTLYGSTKSFLYSTVRQQKASRSRKVSTARLHHSSSTIVVKGK
ncbi:hypothetical protein CEXT_262561 [Caerostris extrusa]|uniref:Uncharacterized protein n=1 Tax=Caerostris extrusa TaxID=172846 RepID=A0AAV4R4N2_CAEEX|nr:hypothetical protein CEXT_262561 [Caerostris extrusa]